MGGGEPGTVWCPACGADRPADGHRTAGSPCADCGVSPVLRAPPPSLVGAVHRVGLRRRAALCIAVDEEAPTFLLPDGAMSRGRVGRALPPVLGAEVAGLRSGAGVLFAHALAATADDSRVPWPAGPVRDAARVAAGIDRNTARCAALDLLDLDAPELLPDVGLAPGEWRWLAATHAARRGDAEALVEHVAALPPGRFRGAVTLLAGRLAGIRTVDRAGERLRPMLEAWIARREPLAGVVARALGVAADGPGQVADIALRARRLLEVLGDDDLAAQVDGVVVGDRDAPAPDRLGPVCRALTALRAPEEHDDLLQAGDLTWLPTPVLEDAVAAGVVDVERVRVGLVDDPRQAAAVAQLDPAALGSDELDADPDEAVRRALRAGDEPPDVVFGARGRHVVAMASLRAGRFDEVGPDDVLAEQRDAVHRLRTAAELAAAGSRHHVTAVVGPGLLADRTVWPVLDDLLGDETADDGGQGHATAFVAWRALHQARGELYARRWSQAAAAARPALVDAVEPRVRAEALNLTACALLHEDEPGGRTRAATALRRAVQVRPSTALRLNKALVLAPLAPEAAAECLVEVAEGPVSAALRRAVAFEALRQWRADQAAWTGGADGTLPRTVRDLLRRAAVEDLTLDDFREVVVALARWDAPWLLDESHLEGSPHRATREARYHRALAAEDHDGRVAVLAEVSDWTGVPRWLADERDRLVASLIAALRSGDTDDMVAGRRAIDLQHRIPDGLGERTRVELALLGLAALHHADPPEPELDLAASVALLHRARAGRATLGADGDLLLVERMATDRIAEDVYGEHAHDYEERLPQFEADMRTLRRLYDTDADLGEEFVRVRTFINAMHRIVRELEPWPGMVSDRHLAADITSLRTAAGDAGDGASSWISSGGRRR